MGVRDEIIIGDVRSAAILSPQRYYTSDMEIADLLPLAAMVVCIAGKLSPQSIQGLEAAVYKKGGGLWILERAQIGALVGWSDGIDAMIGQSVTKRLGL